MNFGEKLRKLRRRKGWSQSDVAKELNIDRSTYGKYETGDSSPDFDKLVQLADLFNVTADYLLGRSIFAIIENRIEELGMTIEEVEKAMEWPKGMLESLDTFPPYPSDYERGDMIDKLSKILQMDFKILASAYARQEPPVYEGSTETPEEAFGDNIETIAAHKDGDDWTKEELETIEKFKAFVRSQRKKKE